MLNIIRLFGGSFQTKCLLQSCASGIELILAISTSRDILTAIGKVIKMLNARINRPTLTSVSSIGNALKILSGVSVPKDTYPMIANDKEITSDTSTERLVVCIHRVDDGLSNVK